jgi:ribosomal protein S14
MARAAQSVLFYDPCGERYGIPTWPWGQAPAGYATRRQLAAYGLRPGGQNVAAQIMWRSRRSTTGRRVAYLYRIDLAAPKRPATPRQLAALDRALAARRQCPECGQDRGYIPRQALGMCNVCADAMGVAA